MMTYKPFEESTVLEKASTPPSRQPEPMNVESFERLASIIAGLTIFARGVARRSFGGLIMGLIGAALVRRGVTGHCPIYEGLGQTSLGIGDPESRD